MMSVGLAPSEWDEGESILCLLLPLGVCRHLWGSLVCMRIPSSLPSRTLGILPVLVSLSYGDLSYWIRGPHYSSMASF